MPNGNGWYTPAEMEAIWNGEPLPEAKMVEHRPRDPAAMAEINRSIDRIAEHSAGAALEDSKAGLADAPSKSPESDLPSLRKGVEVVGEAAAYDFVAGWHERQAKLFREMAEDDPRTAEPQRKRAFEAAIHHAASAAALRNRAADDRRAALVSGSREDGDG